MCIYIYIYIYVCACTCMIMHAYIQYTYTYMYYIYIPRYLSCDICDTTRSTINSGPSHQLRIRDDGIHQTVVHRLDEVTCNGDGDSSAGCWWECPYSSNTKNKSDSHVITLKWRESWWWLALTRAIMYIYIYIDHKIQWLIITCPHLISFF